MERNVEIDKISDGKRYGANDLVKVGCDDCRGCSACCHGMGDSIVLDPMDVYRLEKKLGKTMEEILLAGNVALRVVDGVILPHLKMTEQSDRCSFLNEEGRCSIHDARPGFCRMFPLGRLYEDGTFSYFLQVNECPKENKTKVKVRRWLDTPELGKYEAFTTKWHYYLKEKQNAARESEDDAFRQQTGKDGKGPEITMDNSEISASIHAEESELLAGVTAYDKKDGDVTSSLAVEHISNFVEKGRRKISIVAFDSDNHVTHAERELVYNDYTSPVFSLDRPLRFSLNADDLTEGLSAEDCLDGTITDRIRISYEDEISSTPGLYHVTYSVANRAGDVTSLPVTVELYDPAEENGRPQITLSDYLIHLDLQQPFDPQAYLESVSVDQMLYEKREDGALHAASYEEELLGENQFSIDNPVDTGSAGVYEVTYTATAEDGQTSSVRLIVCVNE